MKRFFVRLLWAVLALIICAVSLSWLLLNRSLPQLDGEVLADGLMAEVTIVRDAAGIPTITATSRRDLAYATGFVHAQERFFQMDLSRRNAAGELSGLFGSIAIERDKRHRLHRFRARAQDALNLAAAKEKDIIAAYTDGVNEGLSALKSKSFEYFLLQATPRPWVVEDSFLVVYSMFLDLNDERATRDVQRGLVEQVLPREVYDWLYPHGTRWDAPLMGTIPDDLPIPGPEVFSLAGVAASTAAIALPANADSFIPGSNNWAVAGSLTRTGRAIVANDMHLGITVPNVFYRARLRVVGIDAIDLNGLTFPGAPVLVAGSNGKIAWGNTNSYGDWSDAVLILPGSTQDSYQTPEGEQAFVEFRESIQVKGADAVELLVRETIWGPLLDDGIDAERTLAVSWIAHHPEAVNVGHLALESVSSVAEALDVANEIGMPPQNFVVGDADGNIGWSIAGKIPLRSGYDAWLPADWSESAGWHGWLASEDYPRIINPASGRIWTANARVADGVALHKIGDGGYDLGARAKQIRDLLRASEQFEPRDMLAVQLDDRALLLSEWRKVLLRVLDDEAVAANPQRQQYRDLVESWVPRASVDSVGYRLVRAFRLFVRVNVFNMLTEPVRQRFGNDVALRISNQFESPLWALLEQQPAHMLSANYASWDDLLLVTIDEVIEDLTSRYDDGLENRSWGERNTARINHPLSGALPMLSGWLDMPAEPLPGDSNMPRAQGPGFGASERFAVAPGDEANGYLHMPVGQSGHPLSDSYRIGHRDWVEGNASSFLPGLPAHSLTLLPAATH